jgi:hypothetical protein
MAEVEGSNPHDLAQAASRAHRAAGSPRRRFVLALGHGLYQQRLLVLPELLKRELDESLRRKAANLLGSEVEDALFATLKFPLERAPSAPPAPHTLATGGTAHDAREARWFLAAMRRSEIIPLLTHLREVGLSPKRTVSLGLSTLCAAERARADRSQACIAVSVEKTSASIGLMQASSLIQHHVHQGSLVSTPSLALALLQEIKSCEAFWRKESRGGNVAEVVLAGLPSERSDLFVNAIHAALPRAKVTRLAADAPLVPGPGQAQDAAVRDRAERLAACIEAGEFQLDLSVHLPVAHRTAILASAAALVVTAALGGVTYERVEHRRARVEGQARTLAAQAAELPEIRSRRLRAERDIAELRAHVDRWQALRASGIPLEQELDAVFSACGSDAALISLTLGRLDQGGGVEIHGLAAPHPWAAVRGVERVTSSLAASGFFTELTAEPAESVARESGAGSARPTAFTITARSSAVPPVEEGP